MQFRILFNVACLSVIQEKSYADDPDNQRDIHLNLDSKQRHLSSAPVQFLRDSGLARRSAGNPPCHFQLMRQSTRVHFTQHAVQHALKAHVMVRL